jgi:hypothetical protein
LIQDRIQQTMPQALMSLYGIWWFRGERIWQDPHDLLHHKWQPNMPLLMTSGWKTKLLSFPLV